MTSRRERRSDILWSLVAIAVLAAGVIGFRLLGALREPVAAADVERVVPPVEISPLVPHEGPVPVCGEGFVRPLREVALAAEMSGRVVALHPAIVSRGRVRTGEVLVRLDERSARAALTRAESDIASTRARLELNATQLERAETLRRRGVVSQEELDRRLAEKAELSAALSSLESARDGAAIALGNATVSAPFDARVLSRAVELGAVVSPGAPLATLFTPDDLEVTVPLTERAAALVPNLFGDTGSAVPGRGATAPGAALGTAFGATGGATGGAEGEAADGTAATVVTTFAGREVEHAARVARVTPALGAGTRMLDVTVALEPGSARLLGEPSPAGVPPALIGSYARVTIEGAVPGRVYALPSSAVRPGRTVWLAVAGRLRIHPAETVHVDGATSYVRLPDPPAGAALVTSVLDAPVDGMAVREARDPDDAPGGEAGESGDVAGPDEPPRAAALGGAGSGE